MATGQYPPTPSSTMQDRARFQEQEIQRDFKMLHDVIVRQPGMVLPENISTVDALPGNHSGTSGGFGSNLTPAYPFPYFATCGEVIRRFQEYSTSTGRQVGLLGEYVRSDGFGKMIAQLFQLIFIASCILLLLYPLEQILDQFLLLGMGWTYRDITALVGILYFGFYVMDRLLLLHVAVFAGVQPAIKFLLVGMDSIAKNGIEVEMGNNTILLLIIGGLCFGLGMLVFPEISTDTSWSPQHFTTEGSKLLNITASTNHFDMTMQTGLKGAGAFAFREMVWGILGSSSKCLNYILQFISTGAWILVHANFVGITVNQMIMVTTERDNSFKKLVKAYERLTKVIRLWIKIYFWVLYFYDQILESFPDSQEAIDLPGVRYLGILSMGLTYCYLKYFK